MLASERPVHFRSFGQVPGITFRPTGYEDHSPKLSYQVQRLGLEKLFAPTVREGCSEDHEL